MCLNCFPLVGAQWSLQTTEIERCACRIKSCSSAPVLLWDVAVFWHVRRADRMENPGRKGPERRMKKERHLWRSLRSREMRPTDWNALALQCLEPMSPLEATSLSPLTHFLTKLLEFLTSWKARFSFSVLPKSQNFTGTILSVYSVYGWVVLYASASTISDTFLSRFYREQPSGQ